MCGDRWQVDESAHSSPGKPGGALYELLIVVDAVVSRRLRRVKTRQAEIQ
jgi:hypothetical protein